MAGVKGRTGRKRGVPNKVTRELKALAQQYTPAALTELVRLTTKAENEAVRVAAIKELFDRAYGKPAQAVTGEIKHDHSSADAAFEALAAAVEGLGWRPTTAGPRDADQMAWQSAPPAGHA